MTALGNRVSQMVNGVKTGFQIDPAGLGSMVASFDASVALTAHYTYGLGLVSQVSATGTAAYYDFNNIGSTVGITGSDGRYFDKYSYSPSGTTQTVFASLANQFQFVGQLGVSEDAGGLYAMGARSYDPVTGQFLSPDPLGLAGSFINLRAVCSK